MTVREQSPNAGTDAWTAVEAAFAALGRVVLLLDNEYHVVRASRQLDGMVCAGTSLRIIGKPVSALLGTRLFVVGDELHRALSQGHRVEGRRAFIHCHETGAQLVSVTITPLAWDVGGPLHPKARFMLVLRPADREPEPALAAAVGTTGLMARAPAMLRVVGLIEALAESEANVLVTGETGTGKGAVAAALHAHSPRRDGPFVVVDVGAIPGELLESELFGHVKGAFTGAHRDRVGQLELATGGTLFLDELGDMPLPLQGKLLRLVEEREFRRLGDNTPRHMDARIISATNVDLQAAIAAGRFREDLYYRLCVVPIDLPPLRERRSEIGPLARHHLARAGAAAGRALMLSPDAVEVLERYAWPGNVRQLNNAVEYAVAMCRGQTVQVDDLPLEVRAPHEAHAPGTRAGLRVSIGSAASVAGAIAAPAASPRAPTPSPSAPPDAPDAPDAPDPTSGDALARVRAALEAHRWNRAAAAAALGMSRTTLWRAMRRLGLA